MNPSDIQYERSFLNSLDGMLADKWLNETKGTLKNARDFELRDTRVIGAGETIATGTYKFFETALDKEEATLGGGATIKKTFDMTNMLKSGELPNDQLVVVESIQIAVFATAREFATITNGRVTSAAPAPAGTTAAANNIISLHRGSYFYFRFGSKDIRAEGRLGSFPPAAHFSGVMGAVDDDGFVQNGSGMPRYLREIIVIPPSTLFSVLMQVPVDLTIAQNLEIEYICSGLLFESVR